ncbi:MAG: hypothetical protein ACE3JP_03980 [Ectobacillus sp.]
MSYISKWYGLPSNYDEWKTSPPEDDEVIVCQCEYCDGDIFAGEEAYKVNVDEWVHEDCFLDYAKEELDVCLDIVEKPEPPEPDYFDDWED